MKPFGIVYGLYHPKTNELRYIGQTTRSLDERLSIHLTPYALRKKVHVACWLRSLVNEGLKPLSKILERALDRNELDQLEIAHIRRAREKGAKLTNIAPGGRVNSGFKKSQEACARISASQKGKVIPVEVRAKISKTQIGCSQKSIESE